MKMPQVSAEQAESILNTCYSSALTGIPGSKKCSDLANEYLTKYNNPVTAANEFISNQVAKCTVSGFATNLGGFMTLPVAIPANLTSVWYIQLRMIATIAIMAGYDPNDDQVQTLAYVCLVGGSMSELCKEAGVKIGNKLTYSLINKIPGSVFLAINKKVSFRLITKAGETGIINMTKLVPFVGGVVGGGFDYVGTKAIANRAIKTFFLRDFD